MASGLGDLFANISAVLEQEYERKLDFKNISSDRVNSLAYLSLKLWHGLTAGNIFDWTKLSLKEPHVFLTFPL